MAPYRLYGYPLSYFSRKLEAALQLYGLDFEFRPKTLDRQSEIESRAGTRQVPVLHTPEDWMIADTTPLLQLLDARRPARRMVPEGALGVLVHLVEEWLDEWLPRAAVHYRWNHDDDAAAGAAALASLVAPEADANTRQMLAAGIAQWGRKSCRATGVDGERQQAEVEAEVERLMAALETQLGETRYALGDRPCAVDAVLLGGLRAHFAVDPTPAAQLAPFTRVLAWRETATDWDGAGELAPFPQSTPFARHVLGEMGGAYKAFILGNAAAVREGHKAFVAEVYGEAVSYKTRDYPERSRQMICERIAHQLDGDARAVVLDWLAEHDLRDVFAPEAP